MASQLKKLAESAAKADAKGVYGKFMKWLRWQGGAMDTYYPSGTEQKREQTGVEGDVKWAYRYPAPGCVAGY